MSTSLSLRPFAALCLAVVAACSGGGVDSTVDDDALIASIRAAFPHALEASEVIRFDRRGDKMLPVVAGEHVEVSLPVHADGELALVDPTSGVGVSVRLEETSAVAGRVVGGVMVYRGALHGATLLHRPSASGTEDFVYAEDPGGKRELVYRVALGVGVKGLRLWGDALEILDGKGVPRLRVSPPWVIGADGTRHDASLAVEGCAFEGSGALPWDAPLVEPGADVCQLHVKWGAEVKYPALIDPAWSRTSDMSTARSGHTATAFANGTRVLVAGGESSNNSMRARSSPVPAILA